MASRRARPTWSSLTDAAHWAVSGPTRRRRQHLRDRVTTDHQRDMPTLGSQRPQCPRDTDGAVNTSTAAASTTLQRVGGVTVTDRRPQSPRSASARWVWRAYDLHDGPHFVHRDLLGPLAYAGVEPASGRTRPAKRRTWPRPTYCKAAAKHSAATEPRTGRTGEQPRVWSSSPAARAVSRITTGRLGRGKQLGFHRLLAYQPRKHPDIIGNSSYLAPTDTDQRSSS